jgi:DNA-binding MarR family transcriptional regulator
MVDGSPGAPGPAEEEVNLAVLLEALDAEMARRLHEALDAAGHDDIRPAHGVVFETIGEDGARVTAMAEAGGMTKQAMGQLVDHLEASGYLERVADPTDRRAKIVRLTARGWAAAAVAEASLRDTERRWALEYGAEDLALARHVLQRIFDGLAAGA